MCGVARHDADRDLQETHRGFRFEVHHERRIEIHVDRRQHRPLPSSRRPCVAALQEEQGAPAAGQQHDGGKDDEQQLLALGSAFLALFAFDRFVFQRLLLRRPWHILDARRRRAVIWMCNAPCHGFPVTGITKSRGKRRKTGGWEDSGFQENGDERLPEARPRSRKPGIAPGTRPS